MNGSDRRRLLPFFFGHGCHGFHGFTRLEQIAVQLMLKADDSPPLPAAGLSSSGSNAIISEAICSRWQNPMIMELQ
jgi:hypothetical protein